MEVGPEMCFWPDSSAELNNVPLLSLPHQVTGGQFLKPYEAGVGLFLELESDSELEQESAKRWDEDVINLTSVDLEDSETASPVFNYAASNKELHNKRTPTMHRTPPITTVPDDKLKMQQQPAEADSCLNSTHDSGMVLDSSSGGNPELPSPGAPEDGQSQRFFEYPLTFPNQTSVECPLCDRTFVNFRSRNIHMNKTHSVKSPTTRTTTRKYFKRKSLVDIREKPAEVEAPAPDSMQFPTPEKVTTKLPTGESASPNQTAGSDTGSTGHETESFVRTSTPLTISANETMDNIPPSYKTRPVYTVSSPTSGSSGNGGALKIRLVSVKHVTRVKHRTKSGNIPQSNNSTTSSTELPEALTPELGEHNRTPASVTSNNAEGDLPERDIQCLPSSPEPLAKPPYMPFDAVPAASKITPSHSAPSSLPQALNTNFAEGISCLHSTTDVSTHQNIAYSPLPPNQSKSDINWPISRNTTHSTDRPSPLPRTSSLATPSPTSYLFSSPVLKPSLSHESRLSKSPEGQSHPINPIALPTLDTTLRTSDGNYKCRVCRRLFTNRYSLTGHYKSHYDASQKPYLCDDCGQRYTSPSNLHYHRARNCPMLKLKVAQSGKPLQMTSKSGGRQNKQTKVVRQTVRKPVRRKMEMHSMDSMQELLPSDMQPTDRRLNSTEPNHLKQSHLFQVPSSNYGGSLFKTPLSTSSSTPHFPSGIRDLPNSSQSTVSEPEIPIHYYSSLFARAMDVVCQSSGPSSVNRTENSMQATQLAGLETHVKQLIERASQSEELYQKILAFISATLTSSALSPNTTDGSTHAHMFNELIRLNQTLCEPTQEQARSIQPSTQAHLFSNPNVSHRAQMGQYDNTISPTTTTASRNALYSCPYCPTDLPVFSDLSTLQKHVVLLHFNLGQPLSYGSHQSNANGHEMPKTSSRPLDTFLSSAYNSTRFAESTKKPVSPKSTNSVKENQLTNLVQCTECDRCFSTHSAYRVHHTKTHHKSRVNRSVALDFETPTSSRQANNWRNICPR